MKKLNNVTILRVIAMLSIFCYHTILAFTENIYTANLYFPLFFGVQIFMFISGYLYSTKEIKSFKEHMKNRFFTLMIPYYIFMAVLLVVYLFLDIQKITIPTVLRMLFCIQLLSNRPSSSGHLWYIFFALLCYLFVPLLIKLRNHFQGKEKLTKSSQILLILFIILIFAIEIAIQSQIVVSCFVFGFFYGVWKNKQANQNKQAVKEKNINECIIASLLLVTFISVYYLFNSNINIIVPRFCFNFFTYFSTTIIAITFSILILKIFKFTNNRTLIKPIRFLDNISYGFFIVHHFFLITTYGSGSSLSLLYTTPYIWLNILLAFATSILSAFILTIISNKIIKQIKHKIPNNTNKM